MIDVTGLVVLLLFYAVILVVGIVAAKKFKLGDGQQSELSLVAGRKIGTVVGIFTMTATVVGGGYLNGTAESVARSGLIWTLTPFCIFLGLILGGLIYALKMRDGCYLTMLDPFQLKYGNLVTVLVYLATLCGDLFWTASILAALGTSVGVILDLNITISIIVSACVTVFYTLFGQMVSVAYTDIVELIFITAGLVLSLPFILMNEKTGDIRETKELWIGYLDSELAPIWADLVVAMTLGTIPWQSYFQRVLSMRTSRDAQLFSVVAAFTSFLLAIPPVLIGIVGVNADWTNTSIGSSPLFTDQASVILPLVVHEFCPPAVALLALAAVCAAVMSSMDGAILGSSSMFTHNIFKNIIYKNASDRVLLWVQRVTILVIGAVSTVITLKVNTIFGMFIMAADTVFISVLPNLTCALFIPFSNAYGGLLGYLVGFTLRLGAGEPYLNLPAIIKYPLYDYEIEFQLFPYRTLAFICALLTVVIVSAITNFLCDNVIPRRLDILGVVERRAFQNVAFKGGLRKHKKGYDLPESTENIVVKRRRTKKYVFK